MGYILSLFFKVALKIIKFSRDQWKLNFMVVRHKHKINFVVSKFHFGAYEGWQSKAVGKCSNKSLFRGTHFHRWLRLIYCFMVWVYMNFPCSMIIFVIFYHKAPLLFQVLFPTSSLGHACGITFHSFNSDCSLSH